MDSDGELYVMSKSDGMIRKLVAALSPPVIQSITWSNELATLSWPSISNRHYRVQFRSDVSDTNWDDVAGDVTATNSVAWKTDNASAGKRFYRAVVLP